MNDLYTRDRMERNAADFEGSGIGSGRYDKRQERSDKFREITLPVMILIFMLIAWASLVYSSYPDIYYRIAGKRAEGTVITENLGDYHISWTAPDGTARDFRASNGIRVVDGKVDVYYINGDYDTGSVILPIEYWAPYYIVMLLVTVGLIIWIKRTLFAKKHALYEKKEHSYKDY